MQWHKTPTTHHALFARKVRCEVKKTLSRAAWAGCVCRKSTCYEKDMHGATIAVETRDGARAQSDEAQLAGLHALVTCEKQLGAEIVLHLDEVENRRLHISMGYSSLYAYGITELDWSENVAHKRAKAARAARVRPEIVHHLANGDLTLASVFVLAPHLEGDAGSGLIAEACGKSRREVERQMAERFGEPSRGGEFRTRPLAEGKTRLEITITARCEALLREAADLDGHRQADMAEILEQALADYVEKRKAERHGQVKKPRTSPAKAPRGHAMPIG